MALQRTRRLASLGPSLGGSRFVSRRTRATAVLGLVVVVSSWTAVMAQVTANVLTRVFPFRYGDAIGSSFTVEVDGRQYLLTARHLVSGLRDDGSIELHRNGEWNRLKIKRLPVEPSAADIAVLVLPSVLPQTLPIDLGEAGLILSEELYFLGFPYGLTFPGALQASGFPFPFVKRGICSAFGPVNGTRYVFLDGHNNPGFSGGPIVRSRPNSTPTIIAVVAGFRHADEAVLKEGKPTEYYYRANTGIVVGTSVTHAADAIRKRPIGPSLPTK